MGNPESRIAMRELAMGSVTVTYSQLCDMVDDSRQAWRVHELEHPTGEGWSGSASEAAAMWRAIGLVFGVRYTASYHQAYNYIATRVKANPGTPSGTLAIGLMRHMGVMA